jgi:4-hydroxy-3-polyprenylbenzoate decarboxylase
VNSFVEKLEKENELIRIKGFVDPVLEITEITDRFSKQPGGGKALLFENNGTSFPVLINSMGSEKRICMALNVSSLDDFSARMQKILSGFSSSKKNIFDKLKALPLLAKLAGWMPSVTNHKGRCQEIIIHDPDLSILPVLKCWPADGGRFITLPLVHTKDPVTGSRNIGMYRMQVFSKNTTGMHWHKHKTGARHFEEYKKTGKKMPVAVALGGDPVYTYSATAPLPDGIDEYLLAGFLRNKKVELVKCITQDIEVPADADIVIEGFVDPSESLKREGPFGDHTGFYSLEDDYPVFHVTCITHKKNAIYPATIVGIPPQEDGWMGKATERIFIEPMRQTILPEMTDMDMPVAGTFHNLVIISIKKHYAGQAIKAMNALWGAGQMMFNKNMIVVDDDVNAHDYRQVLDAVSKNALPSSDLIFSRGPLDVLDHSSPTHASGSKLGIDATRKLPEEKKNPAINKSDPKRTIEWFKLKEIACAELTKNILLCLVDRKKHSIASLKKEIDQLENADFSYVIMVDSQVDLSDLYSVVWLVSANIDPARDIMVFTKSDGNSMAIIDGTFKIFQSDLFPREWPNVVVSEDNTNIDIDKRWDTLGLGEKLPSPSSKYKKLSFPSGAVVAPVK